MPSKSELKSLGERRGWTVREISAREIQQMSAEEVLWHEAFNRDNFDGALERQRTAKHNREAMGQWAVRLMWEGKATPEQDVKARAAGNEFAIRFPTFERTVENAQIMVEHMREHSLDATRVDNYVAAYKALVEDGKLTPAPAQSSTDFYKAHPELHDTRTPPIIAARNAKQAATEKFFAEARESTATARSGATRVTDYGNEQQGVPPYSDIEKTSLRSLVRRMSAAELEEKCQNDPSFKKALDSLE